MNYEEEKDRNQIDIDLMEEPRFGGASLGTINEHETVGVYALPRADKPLFLKREKYNDFRIGRNQTDSTSQSHRRLPVEARSQRYPYRLGFCGDDEGCRQWN